MSLRHPVQRLVLSHIYIYIYIYIYTHIMSHIWISHVKQMNKLWKFVWKIYQWVWKIYVVAMISRLPKIIGLFCSISSLLQVSFAKETYNLKEPTSRSHPISFSLENMSNETINESHHVTHMNQPCQKTYEGDLNKRLEFMSEFGKYVKRDQ